MMPTKISVIIPVYNAETYLEKCVESVLELPYEKEIILIDDGSQDEGGEICDAIAARYDNVKVVHQENKGVSVARNRGLELAKGDYVWFVDADDSVVQAQQVSGSKFQVSGLATPLTALFEQNEKSQVSGFKLILLPFIWEENGEVKEYKAYPDEVPYNLWRCWFDRAEIERQGLRFTVGRKYAEDQEFILRFLLGCQRNSQKSQNIKTAVESPVYYYTMRPGSAMTRNGVKAKKVKDVSAVLFTFIWQCLCSRALSQSWTWKEMKRLAKTLYVTLK